MNLEYNSEAPKKSKLCNISHSKSFENNSNKLRKKEEEKKWKVENIEAIEVFNERIEKEGTFSNTLRSF